MKKTLNLVGFDCGNSSYRVVLGRYDGERITQEPVFREENRMIRVGDAYYWDMLRIFSGLKQGLAEAVARAGSVDAVGICTWGIDFSLLDRRGNIIANSLSYRNEFGQEQLDALTPERRRRLFDRTGILCDRINTVYMLASMRRRMPEILSIADRLLMVPDTLNYLFCGEAANEPSELSTTQLMDVRTRRISPDVCREFAIDPGLFCRVPDHGEAVGFLRPDIRDEVGLGGKEVPVVCVPSHDTASAALAVPAGEGGRFAFVSAGTWSLIGVELAEPVIDDAVYAAGLTNEVGAFNRITLLRNNAGMYIIQRLREEYESVAGRPAGWDELCALAGGREGMAPLFDVNHPDFFNPRHMGGAIWSHLARSGQAGGADPDWPTLFAAFHHSLACGYAAVVDDLERAGGKAIERVYVVGGGAQNGLLNQMAADYSGRPVSTGSPESASLGNIAAQLRYFDPSLDMDDLRIIVKASITGSTYEPSGSWRGVLDRYRSL